MGVIFQVEKEAFFSSSSESDQVSNSFVNDFVLETVVGSRVARFFLAQHSKTGKIYQNDHKM
jgi:hypothetical protein